MQELNSKNQVLSQTNTEIQDQLEKSKSNVNRLEKILKDKDSGASESLKQQQNEMKEREDNIDKLKSQSGIADRQIKGLEKANKELKVQVEKFTLDLETQTSQVSQLKKDLADEKSKPK